MLEKSAANYSKRCVAVLTFLLVIYSMLAKE